MDRLNALERKHNELNPKKNLELTQEELSVLISSPLHPVLEWWSENYLLIRDYSIRRYPFHCLAYDLLLNRPEDQIPPILSWLGQDLPTDLTQRGGFKFPEPHTLDIDAGIAAVLPNTQTQKRTSLEHLSFPFDAKTEQIFDDFYECFTKDCQLPASLIKDLNQCDKVLQPQIKKHRLEHQIRIRKILIEKELEDRDIDSLKRS